MAAMSQRHSRAHSIRKGTMADYRRQQERHDDLKRYVARDKQMMASLKNEERLERLRDLNLVQNDENKREKEDAYLKAEQDKINKQKLLEQEKRMAEELDRINLEKLRDDKIRQCIRQNSSELRELEGMLKSAYLNRERAAQIAEKEAMRNESLREEAEIAHKMRNEHEQAAVETQMWKLRRQEELLRYQQDLKQQLEEKERKRQKAYEEFLKDKLLVDEIVRKIYEEDQLEHQLRLERRAATQRYIDKFKKQQADWRRMEQEKIEDENRQILEYAKYKEKREQDRMTDAKKAKETKENFHKLLAEKFEVEQRQREEMERIQDELCLEEQAEAARQKDIEEMERRIRQRLEMQHAFQEQQAFKQRRRQAEKEEEETFRHMMMAKFAEDDRIEQMNAQKRRMKQQEHKRSVEKLMEERRQNYLADREREAEERAAEQEREAMRQQIIEEERLKLLKLHATKLLGYLPKGIFKEDDFEHFDEDFKSNFKKSQAGIYSEEDWEEEEP